MKLFGSSPIAVALIDVRTSSVGAGYAVLYKNRAPLLAYATRVPIDPHATEPFDEAFNRTLGLALDALVKEGSPILRRTAGSGTADRVLVSFTAPWQNSHVFSHEIQPARSFVFTKQTLSEVVRHAPALSEGWTRVKEMVIATLLNGYEVANPFGKRAKRAELLMLSSSVHTAMAERMTAAIRRALHQHRIEFDAFMPDVYEVFREFYPTQRDYLALDIGSYATDILLVKHGFLVAAASAGYGSSELSPAGASADAERTWLTNMSAALSEIAKQEPLPRTVFLLSEGHMREELTRLLDAPVLRGLWLSDEPLAVLPIVPEQMSPFLAKESVPGSYAALEILALAAEKRYL